jgi:hypothetical protein
MRPPKDFRRFSESRVKEYISLRKLIYEHFLIEPFKRVKLYFRYVTSS